MAHWAELNQDNVVLRVTVGDNNDPNGDEGYKWLIDNLGGTWIQTSYNATIRKNFASVGYVYLEKLDAFMPPKPFNSWILDEQTYTWVSPTEKPVALSMWSEKSVDWITRPDSGIWVWDIDTEEWNEPC